MSINPPPLPDRHEWARFSVSDMVELHAGKQSRVFRSRIDGSDLAIKLTDRQLADPAALKTRMTVVESLAAKHPGVVPPHPIDRELVQSIGGWLMTATPFQSGDSIDLARPGTSQLLGRTLAQLHRAMALVPTQQLSPVAALRETDPDADRSSWQLLHGDFNEHNMVATPNGLRVFDFDECGYGPIEYDVANSVYMVLFDAEVHRRRGRYDAFRPAFLAGYADGSGARLDEAVIDDLIAVRVRALGRWLDDLTSAPIGIRTSSAAWQDVLRAFVRSHHRHQR